MPLTSARLIPVVVLIIGCNVVNVAPSASPQRSKEATPIASAPTAAVNTPTAAASAPTPVASVATPEPTPAVTTEPSPTPPATAEPTPTLGPTLSPDPLAEIEAEARDVMTTLTGGLIEMPEGVTVLHDPVDDLYSFGDVVGTDTPWIDILIGVGFIADLDETLAAALSELFPCVGAGAGGGIRVAGLLNPVVSCNQPLPLQAGLHAVILTGWNGPLPQPFPQDASCSWGVQTNVDDDLTTGFPNPPPGHPLRGSEIYHEMLMFYGADGDFQNYNLATDYRDPPRSDTGQHQGNLPTEARAGAELGGTIIRDRMWVWHVIPSEDFGANYGAHGYCFGDVNNRQETLAVDVLNPFEGAEAYYDLIDEIFPPRD